MSVAAEADVDEEEEVVDVVEVWLDESVVVWVSLESATVVVVESCVLSLSLLLVSIFGLQLG